MPEIESNTTTKQARKHGAFPFVLSGVSFIPLIGVLFGIICIAIALFSRKSNSKLLAILGGCGILVTVVLYGVILPYSLSLFEEGEFSELFEPHAKSTMTSMVRHIEYYKLQNSRYPNNLEDLRSSLKKGEMVFTFDVSGPLKMGEKPRDFYYKVIRDGKNYLLFSVGSDGIPFTEDDIYPLLDPNKDKATGWLKSQ